MKHLESSRIAEVVLQGRSMTWGESLQCRIVRVQVSQCPSGGWRNHQGCVYEGSGGVRDNKKRWRRREVGERERRDKVFRAKTEQTDEGRERAKVAREDEQDEQEREA
jgi:hypothetical protein